MKRAKRHENTDLNILVFSIVASLLIVYAMLSGGPS